MATITFDEEQTAKLFELLGLPPETDPTDTKAILAVLEDLAKQAGDGTKPSEIAAAAKRIGLGTIDADTLENLHREATEGRQLKAAEARRKVEASVSDAIGKGKITPARRKHWVTLISADPGMAEVLASVPDETAVPISEIGHAAAAENGGGSDDTPPWFR
ncbi:phage protease [Williamsia muralis]|uniref:phage protease n=1 Tax=Williamsia marianensis TaxID=85044 RepID=UPI003F1769FC